MIAEQAVRAGIIAALNADGAVMAAVNAVVDGEAGSAALPWIAVGAARGEPWGTKDRAGREVVVALTLRDRMDDGAAAGDIAAAIGAALESRLAGAMPAGIELAAQAMVRTRMIRPREGDALVLIDVRCRVWG